MLEQRLLSPIIIPLLPRDGLPSRQLHRCQYPGALLSLLHILPVKLVEFYDVIGQLAMCLEVLIPYLKHIVLASLVPWGLQVDLAGVPDHPALDPEPLLRLLLTDDVLFLLRENLQLVDVLLKGCDDIIEQMRRTVLLVDKRTGRKGADSLLAYSRPTLAVFNFQHRLIYNVFKGSNNRMGNTPHNRNRMDMFNIERSLGNMSVLKKKQGEDVYLMKTYNAGSKEELVEKLRFFKEYREKMQENQELTKMVEIVEEKDESFCSTTHRLHVIYEYSDLHIGREIKVRRDSMRKISKNHPDLLKAKYFSYQDLCNILYSCLSALWFNKQLQTDNPDAQLKKHGTIFLSTHNILIFGNGTLKIMDPFINDFSHRYNYDPSIYYSPEKLANFGLNDDQKCAIFQLGMTLLEISLLEGMTEAYCGFQYREEVTAGKLKRAREVYASEIESSLTVSVFDLLEKMLERDRLERFNLQEAIDYAEQMYEVQQSFAQEISPPNPAKFLDQSNSNKKQRNTNHSSSPRKSNSINKFQDFKNSAVFCREDDSLLRSPKVTNFTIHEVQPQRQENSSMLESLKVDNVMRNEVNQSIMQGSVFSGINIADSYVYGNHCNTYKFASTLKQEKLFTDPELMNTIYRELRQIQERKRYRSKDENMFCSKVQERRDRYQFQPQFSTGAKITNKVYLA